MQAIVDCNSFYCSCERLFQPQLQNLPVVVLSNNDGCIVSRSDEAKQLGIAMAVPYFQAKELIEKLNKKIEKEEIVEVKKKEGKRIRKNYYIKKSKKY